MVLYHLKDSRLINCLTLCSPDFDNVLLVWLKTSLTISWSGIRFIDSVATMLLTKALSGAVYLDTFLCNQFIQINFGSDSKF